MAETYKELGFDALTASHEIYRQLLAEGTASQDVQENQFGEMAMQIDIAAEKMVIDALQVYSSANEQGIQVISEEHGDFVIGENPTLTALIDGLDGSTAFKESGGEKRSGTMFALYQGTNPRFEQYLLGGIADHKLGKIVVAVRGEGATVRDYTSGTEQPVHASHAVKLDEATRIYIDEGVENYPTFPHHDKGYFYDPIKKAFSTRYEKSSAVYFFDLAVGAADIDLEYGRKNNLEHMVAYPLMKESGAVMEFLSGGDIGSTTYEEYCDVDNAEFNNGYPAIIAAATPELAAAVRAFAK